MISLRYNTAIWPRAAFTIWFTLFKLKNLAKWFCSYWALSVKLITRIVITITAEFFFPSSFQKAETLTETYDRIVLLRHRAAEPIILQYANVNLHISSLFINLVSCPLDARLRLIEHCGKNTQLLGSTFKTDSITVRSSFHSYTDHFPIRAWSCSGDNNELGQICLKDAAGSDYWKHIWVDLSA